MRKQIKAVVLAALASILGCAGYFIAEYNPAVESGATALQQKVDDFLVELEETSGTPEGEYEQHAGVYEELRGDIAALRDLAGSQRGNALTLQSLDLIEDNVRKLETMHSGGISPEEIRIVRTLFDTQFRMLVQLENGKRKEI